MLTAGLPKRKKLTIFFLPVHYLYSLHIVLSVVKLLPMFLFVINKYAKLLKMCFFPWICCVQGSMFLQSYKYCHCAYVYTASYFVQHKSGKQEDQLKISQI